MMTDRVIDCFQWTCQVGDSVLVTAMNINGQWEGEVNGRRGDFPFVYIQFDDDEINEWCCVDTTAQVISRSANILHDRFLVLSHQLVN